MLRLIPLILVMLFVLSLPAHASPRRDALRLINEVREMKDCAPLRQAHRPLLRDARRWSQRMAKAGELGHSFLRLGHWSAVGEVVGVAHRWRQIITLLFRSPEHRRILLDCDYDVAALSFVFENDVWLTGRFYAR